MTTPEMPQPVFPHRAYGVDLTPFGEEGGFAARGHVDRRRFIAACNRLARTGLGLHNMCDDRHVRAEHILADIKHVWAVSEDPAEHGDEFAWWVSYGSDVTESTPGAIPMTVWEP